MALRKGQKLINYIRVKKFNYKNGESLTWDDETIIAFAARIELYLFNMSDAEFEEALKE